MATSQSRPRAVGADGRPVALSVYGTFRNLRHISTAGDLRGQPRKYQRRRAIIFRPCGVVPFRGATSPVLMYRGTLAGDSFEKSARHVSKLGARTATELGPFAP
jgi:hypothetical protein